MDWNAQALAVVSSACLLLISLVTFLDVAMRLVFGRPAEGLFDLQQMALLVVIGACFPIASYRRQHVAITFVVDALGPRAARALALLRPLTLAVVLTVLAFQIGRYACEQWLFPVYSQHLDWPMHVRWSACALFIAVAVPIELARLAILRAEAPATD
jgi:TRAP-type C4-dicarboxylate transport system permease small subunit